MFTKTVQFAVRDLSSLYVQNHQNKAIAPSIVQSINGNQTMIGKLSVDNVE